MKQSKKVLVTAICLAILGLLSLSQHFLRLSNDSDEKIRGLTDADIEVNQPNPNSIATSTPEQSQFPNPAESDKAREVRVLFTTGAYQKAVALIDQFLADSGLSTEFRAWLTMQLPIVLGSAGWAAIATGDCESAILLLRRATNHFSNQKGSMPDASVPDVPPKTRSDILRGLGYCLKKSGNSGGAEDSLRQALDHNPEDKESRLLLVDVLETDGRFYEGIELLENAPKSDQSTDQAIEDRLKIMRRRAGEGELQQTLRTPHFNISYRAQSHGEFAIEAGQLLESSLDEFIEMFGYREPKLAIDVLLYPRASFSWMLGDTPDWAEGIFDGRMRVPVPASTGDHANDVSSALKSVAPVLRHELIHALNASMTGGRALPPWLEEGLAQRLGEMRRRTAFPFPIKPPPFMPAEKFAASYLQYSATEASSIYRQSLYIVLTLEYHEPDALRKIITNLSQSSATNTNAVLRPLNIEFQALYNRAAAYWQRRQPLAAR